VWLERPSAKTGTRYFPPIGNLFSESDLSQQIDQKKSSQENVERLPGAVRSYLIDMQKMDTRWQKAQLQTILKAAHIYRDGKVELEFRQ